jgi:hypothetical protein
MSQYLFHTLLYLFARYLHIVCATVLVGGTLFYEMIVPPAIDELKLEQQLFIFARARWFFKWIVWLCAAIILISGIVSTYSHWADYTREPQPQLITSAGNAVPEDISAVVRPGWWWAAHSSCGVLALIISVSLTIGKAPPTQPIRWMRLNLIILLLVMFLATATRQTRLESPNQSPGTGAVEPPENLPR